MEAGSQDDETKAGAAGAATQDGGPAASPVTVYTPLFRAQHEDRYRRRDLIQHYQRDHSCNLVVLIDQITQDSITLFAELLHVLDRSQDLYLLLVSPGGDGGVAVRLARMAQGACRELVVIVPELAKSAATILALGAHSIVMGPTSDLGPIDPQILVSERGYVSAKDLIEAVDSALNDVATRPDTYPLHAAMLAGIDSTAVQFARSALASTDELARQAIGSNPDRTNLDIEKRAAVQCYPRPQRCFAARLASSGTGPNSASSSSSRARSCSPAIRRRNASATTADADRSGSGSERAAAHSSASTDTLSFSLATGAILPGSDPDSHHQPGARPGQLCGSRQVHIQAHRVSATSIPIDDCERAAARVHSCNRGNGSPDGAATPADQPGRPSPAAPGPPRPDDSARATW